MRILLIVFLIVGWVFYEKRESGKTLTGVFKDYYKKYPNKIKDILIYKTRIIETEDFIILKLKEREWTRLIYIILIPVVFVSDCWAVGIKEAILDIPEMLGEVVRKRVIKENSLKKEEVLERMKKAE